MYRWMREKICWCCFSAFILQFRAPRKKENVKLRPRESSEWRAAEWKGKITESSSSLHHLLHFSAASPLRRRHRRSLIHILLKKTSTYSSNIKKPSFFLFLSLRLCLVSSGRGWPVWATKKSSQASSESLQLSSALHCVFSMISYGSWEEERCFTRANREREDFLIFPAINIIGGLITHIRRMLKSQTREEKRDLLKDCRIYVYVDGKIFFFLHFSFLCSQTDSSGYVYFHKSFILASAHYCDTIIWISRTFQLKDLNFHSVSVSLSAVLTNWCYEIFCQH